MSARINLAALAADERLESPDTHGMWVPKATVAALVRAVKAAQAEREAGLALWSRWILGEKEDDPRSKVYSDGTPHSVEEQARRLEEHIAAVEALAAALAPFAPGPGEETGE